jgi:hypothetical protein
LPVPVGGTSVSNDSRDVEFLARDEVGMADRVALIDADDAVAVD